MNRLSDKKINEKQIVIFNIGKDEFGVEISEVKEIIKIDTITTIPNVEQYIKGLINLRSKIIVILSLAKKLNLNENNLDKDSRIIITEIGENIIGLIVDKVNEVIRVSADKINSSPELINKEINSDYIEGICMINQRMIILINLVKLLNNKDKEQINKIII